MQRLLGLVVGETTLIWILHALRPVFPVDWSSLDIWIRFTPADQMVMASVRFVALFFAYWVLASTVLYPAHSFGLT